ncbi:hypothetical protein DL768_007352 [Monosporascus sp. mg162]|nr:hypothetical protein DL768_007352 [Monosporascus sp. mg162]
MPVALSRFVKRKESTLASWRGIIRLALTSRRPLTTVLLRLPSSIPCPTPFSSRIRGELQAPPGTYDEPRLVSYSAAVWVAPGLRLWGLNPTATLPDEAPSRLCPFSVVVAVFYLVEGPSAFLRRS